MKEDNTKDQKLKIPEALSHLNYWHVCDECSDSDKKQKADKASSYYKKNKKHYRKLHVGYKAQPSMSYVKNMLAAGRSFTAKDIPDQIGELKRQQLKLKRAVKENENAEE